MTAFVVVLLAAPAPASAQLDQILRGMPSPATSVGVGDGRILQGGETAATDYFKDRTTDRLAAAFAPVVSSAMNEVGVTRQYKALVGDTFDIDRYVVGKALDGLFVFAR